MFDGVPAEQLHQFIAASRTSLPLPLPPLSSFPPPPPPPPLHHHPSSASPPLHPFDPYNINNTNNNNSHPSQHLHLHPQLLLLQPHDHHIHHHQQQLLTNISPGGGGGVQVLHRQSTAPKSHEAADKEENTISASAPPDVAIGDPWSNDELLALLRIRSTMENWFPEFTWEHVSRKLAEVGFKRSAEKCKEKFEEESRYFNNISFTKNYRFLNDLEELYQAGGGGGGGSGGGGTDHHQTTDQQRKVEKVSTNEGNNPEKECRILDEDNGGSRSVGEEDEEEGSEKEAAAAVVERAKSSDNNMKKRKRQRRFDMLKGFCEDIVKRMMAQQEEMHTKLLQEMVKRNEEKLAREEAWKKKEMDRMNKELEIMAHEQAMAGDRQATIINFLKKFSSSTSSPSTTTTLSKPNHNVDGKEVEVPAASSPAIHQNNPATPSSVTETNPAPQSPSSSTLNPKTLPIENPSSGPVPQNPSSVDNVQEKKHDLGKRWPRDEVLALINLRCSLFNNGGVNTSDNQQDKDGGGSSTVKAPLWERISQGMLEMGYKRSAKRCKEKWENINKYFRKTKDVNKKRSLDSRTCPYFHQLSTLYNQGILVPPSDNQLPENQPLSSPAAPETASDHQVMSRSNAEEDNVGDSTKHEKNNMEVQVEPVVGAAFEFEF